MRRSLTAAVLVTLLVSSAAALTVEESVRRFVPPLLDEIPFDGGIAVGVYHRGAVRFFNFGVAGRDGRPVTEKTIFEIGSVTKTFTAVLLARAVRAGTIDLNASIVPELPEGLTLQPAAQAVTPLELATYSSGLPDDPPDLPQRLEMRGIEHYTVRDFFAFLSQWQPEGPLPAPYLYSNTGVGLLGFLLAGSIEGWAAQVRDQITIPLAMTDTAYDPAPDEPGRRAEGHGPEGARAPKWPLYAWAAAGALRSTTFDMVKYVAAHLGHSGVNGSDAPEGLLAAMADTRHIYYRIAEDKPAYQALTWQVRKTDAGDVEIVFKDGGTAGFATFLGYNPAKDLGVVIMANWRKAPVVRTGIDVIGHIEDGQ